ncbi:MAG TPA: branched-chain amino acid ABC transporter permease [Candidatus Limnocylindrales bacterium]|jgi:branched-chain amino acid transport system permease protein|nr:branched-chain amino acid ABC transporter permease [Candidatus Limnocylindrales bacterium]
MGGRVDLDSPWWRTVVGSTMLAVPLIVLALLVELFMGATEEQVAVNFFISLVAVVGFGVYSGNSGIMSFGHVAFMGIGAYVSALLTMPAAIKATALPNLAPWVQQLELPFVLGLVGVAIVVAIVALLFGIPFARLSVESTSVASFAVLLIVYVVLVASADVTRGSQTFYGVPPDASLPVVVVAAIGAVLVARFFRESTPGLRLRASREDELASRSMGVNVPWLRLWSWVLSAVIAGLAGALLGANLTAFSPKQFYFTLQFTLLAMLVVGGTSTVSGAVGGTFLVSLLLEAARRIEAALYGVVIGPIHLQAFGLQTLTLGLVILVVMYRLRDGLFGLRELDEVVLAWWHRPRSTPSAPPTTPADQAGD